MVRLVHQHQENMYYARLRIGPRYDVKCSNIVTSDGLALPWVDEIRTLPQYLHN